MTRYIRIKAEDIQPGDHVARARTHPFVEIVEVVRGPKAVSLRTVRAVDRFTRRPLVYARPQHHQLWWKEVQD